MLPHDKDGFLIGQKIEVSDEAMRIWRNIRKDVSAIKNAIVAGTREQSAMLARIASRASQAPTVAASPVARQISAARVERTRDAAGRFMAAPRALPQPATAVPAISPRRSSNPQSPAMFQTETSGAVRLPTPQKAAESPIAKVLQQRRQGGAGGAEPRKTASPGESRSVEALSRVADALDRTITGTEQIDPALQAANEVKDFAIGMKSTIAPVVAGVGRLAFGRRKSPEERQEGLLRKIWRTLTLQRGEETAYRKAEMRVLKDIKRKPGQSASGTGGGLMGNPILRWLGMWLAPLAAAFFGGRKLGEVIYNWLDSSGLLTKAFDAWDSMVSTFEAVPGVLEEKWNAFTEMAGKGWDAVIGPFKELPNTLETKWKEVTDKVEAAWDVVTGFLKDKFGIDIPAIGEKVSHAAAQVVDAVQENAGIVNKAIKDATGVDVGAKISDTAKTVKDKAESGYQGAVDAVSTKVIEPVAEGAKKIGGMAENAWESAKKIPAKVSARWQDAKQYIVGAADKAGVDPGILAKIANYESGFNSEAMPITKSGKKLSTAHGYGQFLDGTWTEYVNKYGAKYGIEGAGKLSKAEAAKYRSDKNIQAAMLAEFTRENIEKGRRYGGSDDDANVYALHNLGEGSAKSPGAKQFLAALKANPNAPVSSVLPRKVIAANGDLYGDGSISVGDAYKRMGDRMRRGEAFAVDARGGSASPSEATPTDWQRGINAAAIPKGEATPAQERPPPELERPFVPGVRWHRRQLFNKIR